MKRTIIAIIGILAVGQTFAGDKIKLGIKAAPAVSFASVQDKDSDDNISFSSDGAAFRFIVGPNVDFMMNDNAAFSMGLWYSPRVVRLSATSPDIFGNPKKEMSQYNLQYLMVPLYFKLNTNEIADGMKIYFVLGGTIDVKIAEKKSGNDDIGLKEVADDEKQALFSYVDASLYLGGGVEYKLGDVTTLVMGITYNRGLLNIVNPLLKIEEYKPYQHIAIKNNLISLDLGLKF